MTKSKEVTSVQEQLKKELDTLKDRVDPPSGYMISTKGKVFTLPDGSADNGPLICVVLDWVTANTYFEGIYNPKDIKPPACFAIAREPSKAVPSDNSPKKQFDRCVGDADNPGCPKNEWNSDPQGGKGKACKNTRRILVVPADATSKTQPWVISASPTSLKHFDKYVNTLADVGTHPIEVITEISFEAGEAYPSLRFAVDTKHDNLELMWKLKELGQEILVQEPRIETKAA
jgi:hypothetical protein